MLQHKGQPYCQKPCYQILFGPVLIGYGANLASPANYAKTENVVTHHSTEQMREIYNSNHYKYDGKLKTDKRRAHTLSSGICDSVSSCKSNNVDTRECSTHHVDMYLLNGNIGLNMQNSYLHSTRHDDIVIPVSSSKISMNSNLLNHGMNHASCPNITTLMLSCTSEKHYLPSEISVNRVTRNATEQVIDADCIAINENAEMALTCSKSQNACQDGITDIVLDTNLCKKCEKHKLFSDEMHENNFGNDICKEVDAYNSHFDGKVNHQMSYEQLSNGEVRVQGLLHIYWGLTRPVKLLHCDDFPSSAISKWRHSQCDRVHASAPSIKRNQEYHGITAVVEPDELCPCRSMKRNNNGACVDKLNREDVLMRRKIQKFNTVAYHNDAPSRWKRASINGHIFDYDTSVFTPLLGSSTSVTVNSTMVTPVVIATLLDKFKVKNSPSDYVLSLVTETAEKTQEKLLNDSDLPLLVQIQDGANNSRIFIKERLIKQEVLTDTDVMLPIVDCIEGDDEKIPAEVETLMILPSAALHGILGKYARDEDRELHILKWKYDRLRQKIHVLMEELTSA